MYSSRNSQQQPNVTLTFKRSELLYDAANYSFVEGDLLVTNDGHEQHQVFDITQKGNIDRVTRVLNLAHAECVEMLFPYTKKDKSDEQPELDDILTAPEEYLIRMKLPPGFSFTTMQLLQLLIHEYLVSRVLADWMSITNPSSKANWEEKFIELKSKIHSSLVSRTDKVRRKIKPF